MTNRSSRRRWISAILGVFIAFAVMPDAQALSTDATLSALGAWSNGTLSSLTPAFASGTYSYSASASASTTTISVQPATNWPNLSTIQVKIGNGAYSTVASYGTFTANLNVGANIITIFVTAQDGITALAYTYTVTRAAPASTDATLSALTLSSGTLSPTFAGGTISYTASTTSSSITVTPTVNQVNATVQLKVNTGTYATVTSGTASAALALNVGAYNYVYVLVTAQDGTTTSTYTITVTRLSTDATLQSLVLSWPGVLSPTFDTATATYASSVSSSTTSLTVTPAATDQANATIQVRINGGTNATVASWSASAPLNLNTGSNPIEVLVTAQDGITTKLYTITVTRVSLPPNSVSAVAGSTSAAISWTTSTGATSYTATSSPGGLTCTSASSPCTVTGLTPGTAYTFTVTATNSAGTSTPSSASNSITTSVVTAPGPPTIGTATSTGQTGATVAFTAPVSNGGANITSYTVTSSPAGGAGTLAQAGSGTITVTGLTPGTAYTFTVTATNSAGTSTPSSASNSITTSVVTAPGPPTIGTATSTGQTGATVAFTAPVSNGGANITSYTVTSSPAGGAGTLAQAGSGTITVTGLTPGTAYTFTVTATNSAGTSTPSSASNSITTSVVTAPGPPTIGTATSTGQTGATVAFTAPVSNGGANITSYTVTSSPAGGAGTLAQAGSGTITVTGLTPGTAYTFTVTATNSAGTSTPSSASNSITTSVAPPVVAPPVVAPPVVAPPVVAPPVVAPPVVAPPVVAPPVVAPPVASITKPLTEVVKANEGAILFASIRAGDGSTVKVSVTVPSKSTLTDLTITIRPVIAASEVASGYVTIQISATDSEGLAVTQFEKPLAINLGKVAAGATPVFSQDGNVWTAIQPLSGTILTTDLQQGYYRAMDGSTIILSRHLTEFGAKIAQRPLVLTASSHRFAVGNTSSLTISGGSGDGKIEFTSNTPDTCSVSTVGLLIAELPGTCTMIAAKSGSGIYTNSVSSALTVTIYKTVPHAPIIGLATAAGPNSAIVSFIAPRFDGGSAITYFTAFSSPIGLVGVSTSDNSSAIKVTGLTPGTAYSFTVTATNGIGTSLPSEASNSIVISNIKVFVAPKPTQIGVVYFTRSTSALDHRAYVALKKILIVLKSRKFRTIFINGFDDITKGLDNIALSRARANTVHAYLIKNQILGTYIVKGDGSTHLIAAGRRADQLNRRVEIWVM